MVLIGSNVENEIHCENSKLNKTSESVFESLQ